jgi:hypothetical protein
MSAAGGNRKLEVWPRPLRAGGRARHATLSGESSATEPLPRPRFIPPPSRVRTALASATDRASRTDVQDCPARYASCHIPGATSSQRRPQLNLRPRPRQGPCREPDGRKVETFVELDGALQRHVLRIALTLGLSNSYSVVTWRSRRYGAVITSPLWKASMMTSFMPPRGHPSCRLRGVPYS